jgi:hypothetical protein
VLAFNDSDQFGFACFMRSVLLKSRRVRKLIVFSLCFIVRWHLELHIKECNQLPLHLSLISIHVTCGGRTTKTNSIAVTAQSGIARVNETLNMIIGIKNSPANPTLRLAIKDMKAEKGARTFASCEIDTSWLPRVATDAVVKHDMTEIILKQEKDRKKDEIAKKGIKDKDIMPAPSSALLSVNRSGSNSSNNFLRVTSLQPKLVVTMSARTEKPRELVRTLSTMMERTHLKSSSVLNSRSQSASFITFLSTPNVPQNQEQKQESSATVSGAPSTASSAASITNASLSYTEISSSDAGSAAISSSLSPSPSPRIASQAVGYAAHTFPCDLSTLERLAVAATAPQSVAVQTDMVSI